MKNLRKNLLKEREELKKYQDQIQRHMDTFDEGSLRVAKRNGHPQYFQYIAGGKQSGIYLPPSQSEIIGALAQKDYEKKVLAYINERLPKIDRLLKVYNEKSIDNIYLSEIPERKKWIRPIRPVWNELVKEWAEIPYKGLPIIDEDDISETNRGEKVRSKSEKILADLFDKNGLYYKYECPLNLPPYGIIYPDFTFLSPYTYQEVYWEHFGRMDDPEYAAKTVKKINLYEKNHIYPGERLILTFEANHTILNNQLAQQLINRYLLLK